MAGRCPHCTKVIMMQNGLPLAQHNFQPAYLDLLAACTEAGIKFDPTVFYVQTPSRSRRMNVCVFKSSGRFSFSHAIIDELARLKVLFEQARVPFPQ